MIIPLYEISGNKTSLKLLNYNSNLAVISKYLFFACFSNFLANLNLKKVSKTIKIYIKVDQKHYHYL